MFMRSLALSCVLLYALVGFAAGACPSPADQPSSSRSARHQHHQSPNKPAAHALACAWACHASANQAAIDTPSQFIPVWLAATWLLFPTIWTGLTRLLSVFARPPPLVFS